VKLWIELTFSCEWNQVWFRNTDGDFSTTVSNTFHLPSVFFDHLRRQIADLIKLSWLLPWNCFLIFHIAIISFCSRVCAWLEMHSTRRNFAAMWPPLWFQKRTLDYPICYWKTTFIAFRIAFAASDFDFLLSLSRIISCPPEYDK